MVVCVSVCIPATWSDAQHERYLPESGETSGGSPGCSLSRVSSSAIRICSWTTFVIPLSGCDSPRGNPRGLGVHIVKRSSVAVAGTIGYHSATGTLIEGIVGQ